MRVTKAELTHKVAGLQDLGIDIDIHWAYGQPRCTTKDQGQDLSPRLPMGEMKWWLHGYECGIVAQQERNVAA